MSKNKLGLAFRFENAEDNTVAEEVSAEETLATETAATDATAEVESASGDVTDVVTGIENATEASSELGAVEDSLQEAVDSGEGVSPREAEHIQARLERVADLLGTTTGDMGLTFRRESFNGKESKLAATKMRLEFVQGWGKKIWEMIKKAWEWVSTTVKNFIGSLTNNADALIKRLEALEKQVAENGAKAKAGKIKTRAKDITVNGTAGFDSLQKLLGNVNTYAKILDDVTDLVAPGAFTGEMSEAALKAHVDKISKLFSQGTQASGAPKGSAEGSKAGILLPGNKTVVIVPKAAKGGEGEQAGFSVAVVQASEKAAEDYQSLTADQMKTVLKSAIAGARSLKNLQGVQKEMDNIVKANIVHTDKMITNMGNMHVKEKGNDATKDAARADVAVTRTIHNLNVSLVDVAAKHLPKAMYDVCSIAGDVVASSLSSKGEGDAAANKEDKK